MSLYPGRKTKLHKDWNGQFSERKGEQSPNVQTGKRSPALQAVQHCVMAAGLMLAAVSQAADAKTTEPKFAKMSNMASKSLLLDVTRAAESPRMVTVGDRGHILFSDDNGISWNQAKVPTIQMLTAVYFPSDKVGYAVGHDAIILKTSDGGESWERVYDDLGLEAPLLDVWFDDVNTGIALGAYGTILQTRNGGKDWVDIRDRINNEEEFHYNAIAGDGDGNVYIAGEAGILFHSPDSGRTWNTLESPYEGSLFGVSAGQGEVLIHGLRGNVFRSTDQGKSWRAMSSGTGETLFGSAVMGNGKSILVGTSGSFVSGKAGQWSAVNRSDRVSLSALAPGADGNIVVVGQGGIHRMSPTGEVLKKSTSTHPEQEQ
ncbi:WD40/YVTN/BNR-like repeat-containing protein [Endozoicomonas arenosclerae]|uniref:WD40/YVTN/BNR-like repeat-containing protein n=1 Tax=Endozoicomonas arenosclerae TaxID=1633495 RepID=UPI000AB540E4|nr:YCF48-related protein [Endozoicomonas arenosclerae]